MRNRYIATTCHICGSKLIVDGKGNSVCPRCLGRQMAKESLEAAKMMLEVKDEPETE